MLVSPFLSVCFEFTPVIVLLVGLLRLSSYIALLAGLSPVAVLSGVHKMKA